MAGAKPAHALCSAPSPLPDGHTKDREENTLQRGNGAIEVHEDV